MRRVLSLDRFQQSHYIGASKLDHFMHLYINNQYFEPQQFWELLDNEFPSNLPLTLYFLGKVAQTQPYLVNFYIVKLTQHSQPAVSALTNFILENTDVRQSDAIQILTNIAYDVPEYIYYDFIDNYDADLHLLCWSLAVFAHYYPVIVSQYLTLRNEQIANYFALNNDMYLKPQNYFIYALSSCIYQYVIPDGDFSEVLFKCCYDQQCSAEDVEVCMHNLCITSCPFFYYITPKIYDVVFSYYTDLVQNLDCNAKRDFILSRYYQLLQVSIFPHGLLLFLTAAKGVALELYERELVDKQIKWLSDYVGDNRVDEIIQDFE